MKHRTAIVLVSFVAVVAGCNDSAPFGGAPLRIAVDRQPWNSDRTTGVSLQTRHYQIFTTSVNRRLTDILPGYMEAGHANYIALTGLTDRDPAVEAKPMQIYVMGTRTEWEILTRKITGPAAGTYMKIRAGGYFFRDTCVFWDIGGLGTLATAAHEGLHQFLHRHLTDQLPMWLEEGLCASAEGYELARDPARVRFTPGRNTPRFADLRRAIIQEYWVPIDRLLPMDGGDAVSKRIEQAVGYYGQLWALVQFLRSRDDYRAGLERLIDDARTGRLHKAMKLTPQAFGRLRRRGRAYNRAVSAPLFSHYITDDLPAFEREYRTFAEKLAGLYEE